MAGDTATDTHLRQVQRVVGAEIFCKHFEHQRPWKVLRLKQLSEDNLYLSSRVLLSTLDPHVFLWSQKPVRLL